ncbi:TPA: head decoration protein [Burkholderia vietnamiensis]|nr:head decoration protein [Burkholderia vietnamiensis]MBR7909117.1 head decoration protein [Burkholderia vietnamiensis]HDR9274777.1 head decoration protein [Burkholderia vietnamiensis]
MTYVSIPPLNEQWHVGGFLVSQAEGRRAMRRVAITGGAKLYPGTVLGQQTIGGAPIGTAVALGTNTGNGTIGAITVATGTPPGVFTVEFDDATHFIVSSPAGSEIGHGVTGTPFSAGGVGFTITAGATAFAPADSFTLTAATSAASLKYVPVTSTATDGSQVAVAILYGIADASEGDVNAAVVAGDAEFNASELLWDPSMNPANQATAINHLAKQGLISR